MKRLMSAWAVTASVSLVASAQTTPTPSQPSTPGGPVRPTPSQPERPGTPGSPSTPGMPATPRTPDQPSGLPPTAPGGRDPSLIQPPGRDRMPSQTSGQLRSLGWMEGTWTATVTITPSAESSPIESRGTMTNQWIIGDRFLQGKFEGEKSGREYEGMSYFGYDTTKNEFQTIWMDSNSPEIMQGTGQWDAGQNTLTIRGEYTDAKSGKQFTTRTVAHKESDDRYTWEMFATPSGGSEFRQLQIVFTKGGAGLSPSRTPGMSPGRDTAPGTPRSPSTTPGSGTPTPGGTPRTPTTPGTPSRPGGGGS